MWPIFQYCNLLGALLLFFLIEKSLQYRKLKVEDPDLCSPITKRKIKLGLGNSSALNVGHSRLNDHSIAWQTDLNCKFEIQSSYPTGGVFAVIQHLQLRRNDITGECIDYVQFRNKDKTIQRRYCGTINANINMTIFNDISGGSVVVANSFIDNRGELDVIIFISKVPLAYEQDMNLEIVFTSYADCFNGMLVPCSKEHDDVCISDSFIRDGIVNCPFSFCVDEFGCREPIPDTNPVSIGNKVLIGSVSSLFILFALFILCIWAFRKHKLFCWANEFAHPSPTPESNRNSRVIEMNEQTGARLADSPGSVAPTAPEVDKDLPPSYNSLFPDR